MTDKHAARDVVQRYIDCSGALDADGLARCFDPHAKLCGYLGPKAIVGEAGIFLADVKRLAGAGTDMTGYRASIVAFDANGKVANATVSMEGFAGARFVDYLQLMEQDGAWRIVSKTFTTL